MDISVGDIVCFKKIYTIGIDELIRAKNYSKYRFCIDFKKDYLLFKKIIDEFKNNVYNISMLDLIKYVNKNKKIIKN